jgi:peptidoglycan/xylan/chitin deacetylase (PgdA/CDA1 family)
MDNAHRGVLVGEGAMRRGHVRLSRRDFFLGAGGTAVGVAGITGVGTVSAQMHKHALFHEAYVAAVLATRTSPPPVQPRSTIIWSGPTDQKRLALTFDDGPRSDWTPQVLEVLAKYDVRAKFFVCGQSVSDYAYLHDDSIGVHEFGNHSWDHPEMSLLDYDACRSQLERTQDIVDERLGSRPTLFRPPYGYVGGSMLLAASELQLTTVMLSERMPEERYLDDPMGIVDFVKDNASPGGIWLGHDTGPRSRLVSISYLDAIIERLYGWHPRASARGGVHRSGVPHDPVPRHCGVDEPDPATGRCRRDGDGASP